MEQTPKKNFVKEYWPQLTTIVLVLLTLGQMYSDFKTMKQEMADMNRSQKEMISHFNEKLNKAIEVLNDEDDGVRGDFNVGDKTLQDKIQAEREYENLRAEKTLLEMKLWYYENANK